MGSARTLAFAILALLSAGSHAGSPQAMSDSWPVRPDTVTVEADLFSGRPNPSWTLAPGEIEPLLALLRRLAPVPEPAPEREAPGQLGYRGLALRFVRQGTEVASLEVLSRRVRYRDGAGPRLLADPGREVERFLVASGQGKVEPEVHATLLSEVERMANREKQP